VHVLLLFEYPTLCGGERSMLCLLPRLQSAGCRFSAAAPGDGALADALRQLGVEVVPLSLHDATGVRRPLEIRRANLACVLADRRVDLIHANSLSMARLSGPVAAELEIPSVGHLRDIVRLSRRAVENINRHSLLLAVSQAVAEHHEQQGMDRTRMAVLYNGIDLDDFRPRPATGWLHRQLQLTPDARLLAAIGQIGLRKGLDVLLGAMPVVIRRHPQAHLLIIGERLSTKEESRQLEQLLHALAVQPPLAGHVHFLGWRNDISAILPELALVVHAARQEPLGRVLLEAVASGCAIVATKVGGTEELFTVQEIAARGILVKGAFLVPPGDAKALADGMICILNDPLLLRKLGQEGRQIVEHCCAVSAISSKLLQHWDRLAASFHKQ
jgi:glycosyltransferase involved in cell wall biosynthesis